MIKAPVHLIPSPAPAPLSLLIWPWLPTVDATSNYDLMWDWNWGREWECGGRRMCTCEYWVHSHTTKPWFDIITRPWFLHAKTMFVYEQVLCPIAFAHIKIRHLLGGWKQLHFLIHLSSKSHVLVSMPLAIFYHFRLGKASTYLQNLLMFSSIYHLWPDTFIKLFLWRTALWIYCCYVLEHT